MGLFCIQHLRLLAYRDSNPGPIFSIRGFGIETFPIPGSRRNYVTTVIPLYHISVIDHNSLTIQDMVWYVRGTVILVLNLAEVGAVT
jgi:hypothetical protein